MDIASLEHHTMCECCCCHTLIIAEGNHNIDGIDKEYGDHLKNCPECKKWHDNQPSLIEAIDNYHASHDCDPGPCKCKCGCDIHVNCRASFGPFCTKCYMEIVRYGNDEHGPKRNRETADNL
jgi:hypothetical protein